MVVVGQNGWIRKLSAAGDSVGTNELKPGGGANDRFLSAALLTTGDVIIAATRGSDDTA